MVGGENPSAVAYVKSNHGATLLSELSDQNMVVLELRGGGYPPLYLVTAYFRGVQQDDVNPDLQKLERVCTALRGKSFLISVDANAKSLVWHSRVECRRGGKIADFIATHRLEVCNRPGRLTTFCDTRGQGDNIDITLASPKLAENIKNWTIAEWSISDHRPICIEINHKRPAREQPQRPRFVLHKAKWEEFTEDIRNELEKTPTSGNTNRDATELQNAILTAAHKNIPLAGKGRRDVPWWTPELEQARRTAQRAQYELRRYPNERNQGAYRICRNRYVALIRTEKRNSWRRFVTESSRDPFGFVYKHAVGKLKTNSGICGIRDADGTIHMDAENSARTLLLTLFPADKPEDDTPEQREARIRSENQGEGLPEPDFTAAEAAAAMTRMARRRAPGFDGITVELVRAAWPVIKDRFLDVTNNGLRTETFPDIWKEGDVKFLVKRANADLSNPKTYRPLSLLPVLGKINERLLLGRLQAFEEEVQLLHPAQYGFRTKRGTTDLLLKLKSDIDTAQETYVATIFLDIAGAFDHAWWPAALNTLRDAGCASNLLGVLRDYVRGRSVRYGGPDFTIRRELTRGCPQGSILGPFLWNCVLDGLLRLPMPEGVTLLAYADDTSVTVRGMSRNQLEIRANEALAAVYAWGRSVKLEFAPAKTTAIMMKGKLNADRPPIFRMGENRIRFLRETTYLGLLIGTGFNMTGHLRRNADRAKLAFLQLQKAARAHWGLDFRSLKILYRSVFEALITNASPVWFHLAGIECHGKILRRAQRTALLIVTRAYRTAPGSALPIIVGTLPADILAQQRARTFLFKRGLLQEAGSIKRIRQESVTSWQNQWDNSNTGRHTYNIWPNVEIRLKQKWVSANYHLTQYWTGHGEFRATLQRLGLADCSRCPDCGAQDSPTHAVLECPIVADSVLELTELVQNLPRGGVETEEAYTIFSNHIEQVLKMRETLFPNYFA